VWGLICQIIFNNNKLMTYKEILAHLDALQMHKIKLGLEAMQSFLVQVGRPESRLQCVHIAGTNGKGSVCAALSEILGRAGFRVGVYTSPHLSSVRERFRIGDTYISEKKFAELGTQICEVLGKDQITYFEFTTALGFLWFAESDIDLLLLETGLGGRLDATNVVVPLLSVITSVSLDHEAYLGNTLGEIAAEKAGIIKPGVPVVSAAINSEIAPVVERFAQEKNAPLYLYRQDFDYKIDDEKTWTWVGRDRLDNKEIGGLHCSRTSMVQQENDSLAITVLHLLEGYGFSVDRSDIRHGLAAVRWPGRMEYFEQELSAGKNIRYLLDGAHNYEGVRNLSQTLAHQFQYKKLIGIWGSMADKDLNGILGHIVPLLDMCIFTQPIGERSATPEYIASFLEDAQQNKVYCCSNMQEALSRAQNIATAEDLILIGGSLYLVGAMRQLLLGDLA
jgi:dihydrofolate synthase/folylpolyglutamate synthase